MSRALITGISGQDGGYLSEQLMGAGYEVHGLVRAGDTETIRIPAGANIHMGDLADPMRLAEIVADVEPDEIYNLAGISSVAYSWTHPVQTANLSGVAVVALLEAAYDQRERTGREVRFVQASSSEIFGTPPSSPQNETTPIHPISPYGAAKAYAHTMTRIFRDRGLLASNVILYNHESPRRPESFVTRKITAGVARISLGLQDSLVLGDLNVRRDWGWAPDYVRAMVLAARLGHAGDYVIATGEVHTVAEFVDAAFRSVGIQDWTRFVSSDPKFIRPNEIAEMRGDAAKARDVLGWTPTLTFTEIVAAMVKNDVSRVQA